MKSKECLEDIKRILYETLEFHMDGDKLIEPIKQDLDRLEKLEQKETPMKAITYNINQYKCPKCLNQIKGKKMIYNMETKKFDIKSKIKVEKVYCPYCGQRLDWSD